MYGYIYKTTNLINNKIYIGKKKSEIFLREEYLGSGTILKGAIIKYGKENFKVELLEWINTKEEANEKEIFWISYYNSTNPIIGYNSSKGGQENDFKAIKEWRHDSEAKELRSHFKKYNNKMKEKSKPKIDLRNIFVIHKGKDKKEVPHFKIKEYLNEGWELGWPEI